MVVKDLLINLCSGTIPTNQLFFTRFGYFRLIDNLKYFLIEINIFEQFLNFYRNQNFHIITAPRHSIIDKLAN